eukprot:5517951-Ditylum_brightwellii.AAC.1
MDTFGCTILALINTSSAMIEDGGTLGSGGIASMAYPDLYGVDFDDTKASCIFICATRADANACCDIWTFKSAVGD